MISYLAFSVLLLQVYLSVVKCETQTSINSIRKDFLTCEEVCDRTYPLHTYPKAEHLSSCKRGCRFYSMINVLGTSDNVNTTHQACMNSCGEAYSNAPEKLACNAGCDNQHAFTIKQESQQPQTAHVLQPLMYVQAVYTNVVGHMSRFMSSSWTLYVQEDDGKVVVSKDTPDILQEIMNEDGEVREMDDLGNGLLMSGSGNIKEYSESLLKRNDYIEAIGHTVDNRNPDGVDWLSCVSRQSGVPRKLLLLVLLLAIMVMVWLCCATAATAQEQRVKNLQVNNDLSYLLVCNAAEKVKIQPMDDVLDTLEAPPLPSKVIPVV